MKLHTLVNIVQYFALYEKDEEKRERNIQEAIELYKKEKEKENEVQKEIE